MGMEQIKIDDELFEVPVKVATLLQRLTDDKIQADKQVEIHLKAVTNSGKMISDCQYFIDLIMSGERVTIKEGENSWDAGARLKAEWEIEVKYGLTGWLQDNWPNICTVACECGSLISYDAVRETGLPRCGRCKKAQKE